MTQRFSFYEDLTIEENSDFIAHIYGVPQRNAAVDKSLERLGMSARRKQLAGTLSGGWKQHLALSACLIHEPQLLLLDEPDLWPIALFLLVMLGFGIKRYRQTLD